MTRTLFIIAGAALVLCLASIAGAAALGGRDLADNDWTWVISDDEAGSDDNLHFERAKGGDIETTRTLDWTGGQTLTIDLPVDVTYVQGDKPGVVVTGPKSAVDRVRLVDGRLSMADREYAERGFIRMGPNGIHVWSETERVRITVTAPSVNNFRVAASGDLTIEGYNQPTMSLVIDGSGEVEATGHAAKVDIRLNASGDAELEGLEVTDATVDNTASGEVVVGPTGDADVTISGSGDVRLTRRPKNLKQNVTGSGDIDGI